MAVFVKKIDLFKILLLFLIILSYFVGFFLRENSAGGAESDFIYHTWPAIQGLKENFFLSIKNFGKFGEGSWPMFHILNVFINPFTETQFSFQFSICIVSIINFLIFENIIRNKFKIQRIDSLLLASIILLLPFFRSSAFWGLTENFGWLFLLLSIKYYLKIEKLLVEKIFNFQVLKGIFLVTLFSSLALYTRQYLIFFSIFLCLDILFIKKNFKILFILIVFFLLFSIPGLTLIYLWDGLYDVSNFPSNFGENYHHPKYIIKNLPFLFSFFAFYLFPFFLIEIKSSGIEKIIKKYYLSFFLSFLIMIVMKFFNFFDYLNTMYIGGGAFLKLDYILFGKKLIFFILMSSIGFSLLYEIIKQNFKFNSILLLTLLIYCFPKIIFQEYYEPLVLFLFFLLFNHNINFLFEKKYNFSIFLTIFYYVSFLLSSIYFKHFLFIDFDSWKIFIDN